MGTTPPPPPPRRMFTSIGGDKSIITCTTHLCLYAYVYRHGMLYTVDETGDRERASERVVVLRVRIAPRAARVECIRVDRLSPILRRSVRRTDTDRQTNRRTDGRTGRHDDSTVFACSPVRRSLETTEMCENHRISTGRRRLRVRRAESGQQSALGSKSIIPAGDAHAAVAALSIITHETAAGTFAALFTTPFSAVSYFES